MRGGLVALGLLGFGVAACVPNTDLVVAPQVEATAPDLAVAVPPPRADGRLPDDVRPRRYRLALELDPAAKRFRGEVRIELDVSRSTSVLVLHASGLTFDEVEVRSGERLYPGKATSRRAVGSEREGGRPEELVIETPEPLSVGTAELRIAYQAPIDDKLRGIYRTERDGKSYLITQMEPADARRLLPCFDDPSYKTPFELSVTVPRGQRVFSNAAVIRERDAGEAPDSGVARVRVDFEPTKPLPTYLLALAVGPFDVFEGPAEPVPVRLIAPSGLADRGSFVVAMASELVELFTRRFGTPYPYGKLDLVAVPSFAAGAMENAGLLTFREELLLIDANSSALARRRAMQVIAHELAHQWFGDLVTLKWWDDLWLNEGFASYFESVVADEWRPETRAELEDLAHLGSVMALDSLDAARRVRQSVRTVYEAEEAFDPITYSKGSAVIGMLHAYLGEDAFRLGMQSYLSRHANGNASSDELFRALGDASGRDVGAVARSFVDQSGVPLVTVRPSCVEGAGKLVLEQRQHRIAPHAPDDTLWSVPVCVRYAPLVARTVGASDIVETSRVCTLLDRRAVEVELDSCPAWVQPNDDYRGYYRYALPADALAATWRATKGAEPRARIGFLANAWSLVQGGELHANEIAEFLDEVRGDADPHVVLLSAELLDRVELAFVTDESRPPFERWVSSLFLPLAKELGWEPKTGEREETTLLRETVLDTLSIHTRERWLKDEATRRALAYLRDPSSIDPNVAAVALRASARFGTLPFDAAVKALDARTEPEHRLRIVRALGSSSDPTLVARALDLLLSGTLKISEANSLARYAAQKGPGRTALLAWLEAHLVELADKSDGMHATGPLAVVGRTCADEARTRADATFRPLVTNVGGSMRRLDEALEGAAACTDLRRRESATFSRWLAARPADRRGG